jgi:hypothetical protein
MRAPSFAISLLPPVALAPAGGGLVPAAAVATGFSAVFWMMISYGMKIPAWYGLLYPLGALVGLYIGLRSTWRGARRVEWRGRVYEGVS